MNYMEKRGWYLDKGINPAYVVPLVTAILAGLLWAGGVNKDLGLHDNRIETNGKRIDGIITTSREDMREINRKLDELIKREKRY